MIQLSEQLREYRLLEKLGEGGMGTVYKAVHQRLQRQVAIKVLPPGRTNDPQAVARFEREMQAVGRLDHPNIVRATDAGEHNGVHFLVMEFVAGENLAQYLQRHGGRLPAAVACELARQAALGLQHVHDNRLVHRDVKPSNLMVTPAGVVKILDLGLAGLRPQQTQPAAPALTSEGSLMGTMDYVAPEQLNDAHAVDIRADVYSLGCTLYHLLAGRVPFPAPTAVQKMAAHQLTEPEPLSRVRPDLPPALVQVVARMMAKKPEQRFATPLAVAQALRPFCGAVATEILDVPPAALPVALPATSHSGARPPSPPPLPDTLAASKSRTVPAPRPRRAFPLALVAVLVLAVIGVGAFLLFRTPREVVRLEFPNGVPDNLEILVDGKKVTFRKLGDNAVEVSAPEGERTIAVREGDRTLREEQVMVGPQTPPVRVAREGPGPPRPGGETSGDREEAPDPPGPVIQLAGHAAALGSLDFSPDGRTATTTSPWEMVFWDLKKRKLSEKVAGGYSLARHMPGGKKLLLCAGAKLLQWDLAETKVVEVGAVEHPAPVTCFILSRDGKKLVAGDQGGNVRVWELPAGKLLLPFTQQNGITSVDLAPDQRSVLFGDSTGRVVLWDLAQDRQERQYEGHSLPVGAVRFTADGRRAWTAAYSGGGKEHTIRLWDLRSGKELRKIEVAEGKWMSVLAFSPDLRRALVGHYEGDVALWNLETGKREASYAKHAGAVSAVIFSPGGKYALSGGNDHAVWLYRLPD